MQDRVILHCDCNSFFASVETVLHPEYKNVPMAVCGSVEDRRGIVLAKNELAKKYNVKTAETVYSAKKKCPGLVIAEPHHKLYSEFSKRVNDIYRRYTDLIEPFGIDESLLDVTGSQKLFGNGEEIARKISEDVKKEIGITISVGVSFNKVFAKLGSDYKKPDAITVINRENFKRIVYPLPVSDLLFVGSKTCEQLYHLGIRSIGDLAMANISTLISRLGKSGELIHKYALGEDDSPVVCEDPYDVKSISNGLTFRHDLTSDEEFRIGIEYLSEEIGTKLRRKGLKCTTVQISVKDEFLRVVQRQRPQVPPTDIGREIAKTALEILNSAWKVGAPIRMLTVSAQNLVSSDSVATQMSIFGNEDDTKRKKTRKSEQTLDKLRQKFGDDIIVKGAVIDTDMGIYSAPKRKNIKNDQ